ncbi:MAG: hypothetical protein L0323_06640 [Planctomycetes bacterium]|nr:hypothetical protein [Planctomycetota bacterium]
MKSGPIPFHRLLLLQLAISVPVGVAICWGYGLRWPWFVSSLAVGVGLTLLIERTERRRLRRILEVGRRVRGGAS